MGQQQLLLLVLGVVIVGMAVVAGIQAFGENRKKASADALMNDSVRIASDAQAWRMKDRAMGGGAGIPYGTSLTNAYTLSTLGYPTTGTGWSQVYTNASGNYTSYISGGSRVIIIGDNTTTGVRVTTIVNGLRPECINSFVRDIGDHNATPASSAPGCESF